MKTALVILAAGSSSRMGKPKQLLKYKHTTLLGWTIEQALASKADAVFCVLGANKITIEKSLRSYSIEIIQNKNYKIGISSSIVAAVNYLKNTADNIFIMLADQPGIDSKYLNTMLDLHSKHPTKTVASQYEKKVGVPAIFPKDNFKDLLELKGDKGAREYLNIAEEIITLKPLNLSDVDTVEDYLKLTK